MPTAEFNYPKLIFVVFLIIVKKIASPLSSSPNSLSPNHILKPQISDHTKNMEHSVG